MYRKSVAALVASTMIGGVAAAQPVMVYDRNLSEEFEVKREIVDRIQAQFGETAVFETGEELPESLDRQIVPGNTLPAEVAEPVPGEIAELPHLGETTQWVKAGKHLVELEQNGNIVMVVYDALP